MITYDGLRVLMMAEDDSRCFFGVNGPLFEPKILKIRQYACFFKARLMVMLPGLEIPLKSQKITKNLIKQKIVFLKIENIVRIDAPMYLLEAAITGIPQNSPKPDF